jgi:hypothetical protein
MDSGLNKRHAEDHSAELTRRAELHRLAAQARDPRKPKLRSVRIPHPGAAVFALLSRPRHTARRV